MKKISNHKLIRLFPFILVFLFSLNLPASVVYEDSFKGKEVQSGVLLTWSTASEQENTAFIIERSEDGSEFKSIGAINGAGTSSDKRAYSFMDLSIYSKYLWYRLKQVDVDGDITYSRTLRVVYPVQPVFTVVKLSNQHETDELTCTIDLKSDENVEFHLVDPLGNKIISKNVFSQKGIKALKISLKNFDMGIYKLVIRVGEEEEVMRFEKLSS